jgi:serine/threonine protein kinase
MFTDNKVAKLIDFGMADLIGSVKDYAVCGTENYIPPEMR